MQNPQNRRNKLFKTLPFLAASALLACHATLAFAQERTNSDQLETRSLENTAAAQTVSPKSIEGGTSRAAFADPRVIGGTDAITPGQWEFTVNLTLSGTGRCGGALVSPHIRGTGDDKTITNWRVGSKQDLWVLTAAHCVTDGKGNDLVPNDITIRAGVRNLAGATQPILLTVEKVIPHLDYDPSKGANFRNDIALLKLEQPVAGDLQGSKLHSISLPSLRNRVDLFRSGARHVVNGWGITENGNVTSQLQMAAVPFLEQEYCYQKYQSIFGDLPQGAFCAGWIEGGVDSCGGDSGGPIFFEGNKGPAPYSNHPILTGLVSWGQGCAEPGFPGIYTDVFHFKNWIASNVVSNS